MESIAKIALITKKINMSCHKKYAWFISNDEFICCGEIHVHQHKIYSFNGQELFFLPDQNDEFNCYCIGCAAIVFGEIPPNNTKVDTNTSNKLINNCICTFCKNDRLNHLEKSCWKCGEKI